MAATKNTSTNIEVNYPKYLEAPVTPYTTISCKEALDNLVKAYNSTDDLVVKNKIAEHGVKFADEYNTCSKINAYCTAEAKGTTSTPILELAKIHEYKTITFDTRDSAIEYKKDDNGKSVPYLKITAKLNEKTAEVDIFDFIKWAADKGTPVTHEEDWEQKLNCVRFEIEELWKNFFEENKSKKSNDDKKTISITQLKAKLQVALDAICFIPSEGKPEKNQLPIEGKHAKRVFAFTNQRAKNRKSSEITYVICEPKQFRQVFQDIVSEIAGIKCNIVLGSVAEKQAK